jgi:hypothetical protein
VTSSTARPLHRPWSTGAVALLGAALVLLLQVALSAWHGAALAVALLVVVLGIAGLERRLRRPDDAVPAGAPR